MTSVLGGRYELVARIGSGGMATVWRAFDRRLGREVAIKVLAESLATDERFRRRFEREAHHIASLSHPNIVVVHDFGIDGDQLFIVMELVKGRTLRQLLAEPASLSSPVVVQLATDVLAGLGHAHEADILHRDIKPGNILVTESGTSKLADFGIAKATEETVDLTDSGAILGTVSYASPEQLSGGPIGPPSDLYSLGCVLYECVAGRPPFVADNLVALVSQQQFSPPEPLRDLSPEVPQGLGGAVMRSLAKDPAKRYASAREMGKAFGALGGGGADRPPSLGAIEHPARPLLSQHRGRIALAVTTVLVVVGASLTAVIASKSSSHQSSPLDLTPAGIGYTPKYVSVACPTGTGGTGISCGNLIVPQDRARPKGRQIKLLVVRATAKTSNPAPDPVVNLGDPISGTEEAASSTTRLYANYIGLSARGGLGSVPELSCPGADSANRAALALPPRSTKVFDGRATALAACRARLVASGIDPNAYGNDAAAADTRDLLRVLHIQRANLLANYFGSMLAFDIMRKYPELVRSVTIEDPVRPGSTEDVVADVAGVVDRYSALCSADQRCHAAFPDIRGQFARDYAKLQQNPVTVNVPAQPGNAPIPVVVNGDTADVALELGLSNQAGLPVAASVIYAPDPATIGAAATFSANTGGGTYASYLCKDVLPAVPTSSRLEEQAAILASPQWAGLDWFYQSDVRTCQVWNVQPDDPSDFTSIVSDIPTLLVSGDLDPARSPASLHQLAQGLARAVVVEFPTLTGFNSNQPAAPVCLTTLRLAFLRHPTAHLNVSGCEAQSPPIAFAGT